MKLGRRRKGLGRKVGLKMNVAKNELVYMFLRIQNESLKKECIRVRIRGAFLAKKGAPKLNFHREGGAVAPICPP